VFVCSVRIIFFILLFAISVGYALWRGGKPERAVAIILILMISIDAFVHALTPATYAKADPGHLIIDALAWAAFLFIALRARRLWPLWVSSLQTISLIAHVTKLLNLSMPPLVYAIMQVSSSYLLLIILIMGTYAHQKRLRLSGSDMPWRR
jgi:hypothetical protein